MWHGRPARALRNNKAAEAANHVRDARATANKVMASHQPDIKDERLELGASAWPVYSIGLFVGFLGVVGSVAIGYFQNDGFRRFYFSWLTALTFFVAISLGALFFTILQHLVRAGWSVVIRRTAETISASVWILLVLSAPILVSVGMQKGDLYRWAQPESARVQGHGDAHDDAAHEKAAPHQGAAQDTAAAAHPTHVEGAPAAAKDAAHAHVEQAGHVKSEVDVMLDQKIIPPLDDLTWKKRAWLNPGFFIVRVVFYFAVWSLVGWWYWRLSVRQDLTKDLDLTSKREGRSAPLMIVFALTTTFFSFDLMMSLDPHWFSTMFGVIYFSNAAIAIFATLILISKALQSRGFLSASISVEHYHDLGKFLFAFTFFYGYVAFSQFMLLWYANLPETTGWFARRGATSVHADVNGYTSLIIILLVGHFVIPFAGLLSRHVKRNGFWLPFFAVWQLVMVYLDLYWIILPEYETDLKPSILDLTCLLGIGGLWLATIVRTAARHALRPVADPRLEEALVFHNI